MVGRSKPITALDMMAKRPFTISRNATLAEAAKLMLQENIGCLPVVEENGDLDGLITERMYQGALAGLPRPANERSVGEHTVLNMYGGYASDTTTEDALEELRNARVGELMIPDPVMAEEDESLAEIASKMVNSHLSHMPVVRGRMVVGVIARHDLMRAVAGT